MDHGGRGIKPGDTRVQPVARSIIELGAVPLVEPASIPVVEFGAVPLVEPAAVSSVEPVPEIIPSPRGLGGMTLHRRAFLATAGVLGATAATAGCTGDLGDGGSAGGDDGVGADAGPPPYADWLPADGSDGDGLLFVSVDQERLDRLQDYDDDAFADEPFDDVDPEGDDDADPDERAGQDDPMVLFPIVGVFMAGLSFFGLIQYPFVGDVLEDVGGMAGAEASAGETDDGGDESTASAADVQRFLFVDGALVFEGAFDVEAVDDAVEYFETAGERDGFTVYEATEADFLVPEDGAFAVSEEALVLPLGDPTDERATGRDTVDRLLDVRAGSADGYADAGEADAEWAVNAAGHGDLVIGLWGDLEDPTGEPLDDELGEDGFDDVGPDADDDFEALEDADVVVSSLTFESEELISAAFAAGFGQGEAPDRDAIEREIGRSADDRDIYVEGSRLAVEATWEADSDNDD